MTPSHPTPPPHHLADILAADPLPSLPTDPPISTTNGCAIGGYDPVGYVDFGVPVPGARAFSLTMCGAVWRFATDRSRARFSANPTAFSPAYGGYCAYGVSRGYCRAADPLYWSIYDGRLVMTAGETAQNLWLREKSQNVTKANAHWPQLLG